MSSRLALGGLIGWLVGTRAAAASKEVTENRSGSSSMRSPRNGTTIASAAHELAALRAAQEERERSFEQQIEALREAKESLSAQFHEIGSKFLGEARKQFHRAGRGEVHPGGD